MIAPSLSWFAVGAFASLATAEAAVENAVVAEGTATTAANGEAAGVMGEPELDVQAAVVVEAAAAARKAAGAMGGAEQGTTRDEAHSPGLCIAWHLHVA